MRVDVADVAFHQRLGRLFERLDSRQFWNALAELLHSAVLFDNWVAMVFSPSAKPRLIAESAAKESRDLLLEGYLDSVYLLDPYYQFSIGVISAGVYRLDEVAPDQFRETEYYRRYFSVNVLEDEVQFLAPLQKGEVISLSLGSRQRFTTAEIGTLCLYATWILPLLRNVLQASVNERPPRGHTSVEEERRARFETALQRRAATRLTHREIEVAMMILAGHSSKNIARLLGISPATAKVHRSNLYRKLDIASQSTLFRLFMGEEL
ncbi:helix-turn-helix transcriptional regulator [Burkholderia ubonensis]|uniref:helix-turn-helix domain-containing protein n=1 Tax=Burkholderia ubonensis TaxID=101571 RepID=UPI000BA6D240|nr:helix-turn-helix transcriptional regulator [Burkholderia ubonensis]PAK14497.1 helix-turn-helix transcriptional regulator [Burkholderia ubonensis]RQP91744.1 LuxR family transcriptional regulator [Burkholderia ubonensis]